MAQIRLHEGVSTPVANRPSYCGRAMMAEGLPDAAFDQDVKLHIFRTAAETARVPQPAQIAEALGKPQAAVEESVRRLADAFFLILAPNRTNIWAANPFCAVPTAFRVESLGRTYWGICIWDALGIPAALHADAKITALCGDSCGERMILEVKEGALSRAEGLVHFWVTPKRWWDNIAFT